jgi:hypothetical protein
MPIRNALLAHYSPQMLRPGEPVSMLASRFPLVFLFHRYALGAAINVIGSAKIPLSLAGDGQQPIMTWPADSQAEALRLVLQALQPSELDVQPELWKQLAPLENRNPDPERFTSSAGYLYSPQDGARAVAEIVVGGLLNPERLQRLAVLSNEAPGVPSAASVIKALVDAGFVGGPTAASQKAIAGVVQTEVAERLMILAANSEATAEVRASALAGVQDVQKIVAQRANNPDLQRLDREIKLFLANPQQNTPKLKPSGAPAGPPV